MMMMCFLFFFFFKQKTAYEMRISDWSSDVCSSGLQEILSQCAVTAEEAARRNRMIDIEHILRADAADRAVAVYRQIDRPAFADLQRLRQAIGGKAARAIFADLLLVRGGEKARARPGRQIEAEPRGACLHRIAVGDLVAADVLDVAGHRKTRAEAMAPIGRAQV